MAENIEDAQFDVSAPPRKSVRCSQDDEDYAEELREAIEEAMEAGHDMWLKYQDKLQAQALRDSTRTMCFKGRDLEFHFKEASLKCLDDKQWLNDEVINLYGRVIESRYESVAVVYSGFFSTDDNLVACSRPSRAIGNPDDFRAIFFPLNTSNSHWTLFVLDCGKRTVSHFDSFPGIISTSRVSALAEQLIEILHWEKNLDVSRLERPCPLQTNHYDCGVYVCHFMMLIAQTLHEAGNASLPAVGDMLLNTPALISETLRQDIRTLIYDAVVPTE